jgi:hypothetical protein
VGSDKDGRPLSAGRSFQRCITQAWLATSQDELARSTGGIFYHQPPRAPNAVASDVRIQEELLAECHRVAGVLLDRAEAQPLKVGPEV